MIRYPFRATHVDNGGFILVPLCTNQRTQRTGNHSTSNYLCGTKLAAASCLTLNYPAMLISSFYFTLHVFLIGIGCHMGKHTRIKIPFFAPLFRFGIREKGLKLFKVWLCYHISYLLPL